MPSQLEIYKQEKIKKLTELYNNSLTLLKNTLVTEIDKVNKKNIMKYLKFIQITNLKNIYNKNVYKLTSEYNKNKRKILMLTQIPINEISINEISINEIPINEIPINKSALLIGINYIGTSNELAGCINDTDNIKKLLQDKYKYNNFNIITDYTNKKPTKQNIITELTNLLVNANTGDSLFFLYSGHGTCTIDLNNDELDGQDELIVPLNADSVSTCISDDQINKIIKNNLKEGVTLFMLFDSCFSGTVADLKYNYLEPTGITINPNVSETVGQVFMISGCKDNQTSADTVVNINNQTINSGAMTFAFLKTIQDCGTNISLKILLENMRTTLKEYGYDQIPQLSSGTSVDINNVYTSF